VPGDVIGSGTVGSGCILERSLIDGTERYPWLKPGDAVELDVDGLGTIGARIKAGPEPVPLK
jgi:2-keto-4-pentenoate hydratase/2-oxohepta-3-ene-1,7-dioic acid hydratase in catechol pathway